MPELIRYDQIASYEEYLDETPAKEPGQEPTLNGGGQMCIRDSRSP